MCVMCACMVFECVCVYRVYGGVCVFVCVAITIFNDIHSQSTGYCLLWYSLNSYLLLTVCLQLLLVTEIKHEHKKNTA